jgi:hypothetical protein
MPTKGTKLLVDIFPELSTELQELLSVKGERDLAVQVSGLAVVVGDKIAAVEVLYRDEIRQKLLVELP